MQDTAAIALVLGFAFVAANLPFFTERLMLVGPRRAPKSAWWRLLELFVLLLVAIGVGMGIEQVQGQRVAQGWEFYVAFGCLFLTFAFPGYVWRYLRRGAG
jgi:hypothetical protein